MINKCIICILKFRTFTEIFSDTVYTMQCPGLQTVNIISCITSGDHGKIVFHVISDMANSLYYYITI